MILITTWLYYLNTTDYNKYISFTNLNETINWIKIKSFWIWKVYIVHWLYNN